MEEENNQQAEIKQEIEKKEIQTNLIKQESTAKEKKQELLEILKHLAPGTMLRQGIEGMLKAKTGGMIVIENDATNNIIEGGFKVNCRFTPQRLIELGKMDGAIILSKDMKKILYVNVLMTPDNSIHSNETGTRHKAAERTAKQAGTIVIAISQRRDEITLFYKDIKYPIKETNEIIRRATENLQILEKQRELFDKTVNELDKEELKNRARAKKAIYLIQRGKIITRLSETMKKYITELGTEGAILKIRLKEILYGVERELDNTIKEYTKIGLKKTRRLLHILTYDELIETENIKKSLAVNDDEEIVPIKGYRILLRRGIEERILALLIKKFRNFNDILSAKEEQIEKIAGENPLVIKAIRSINIKKEN